MQSTDQCSSSCPLLNSGGLTTIIFSSLERTCIILCVICITCRDDERESHRLRLMIRMAAMASTTAAAKPPSTPPTTTPVLCFEPAAAFWLPLSALADATPSCGGVAAAGAVCCPGAAGPGGPAANSGPQLLRHCLHVKSHAHLPRKSGCIPQPQDPFIRLL